MTAHTLSSDHVHYAWNSSLAPRLFVSSGDMVTMSFRDSSDGYFTPASTAEDIESRPAENRRHPLTGPIYISGARPGDLLEIEILSVETWNWGFTWFGPGVGLLGDEFDAPYLKIWDLSDSSKTHLNRDVAVPLEPFLGVLGVAPSSPGDHSTTPPRPGCGGNLDLKHLSRGSTLWLPVQVDGALFSAGDPHAAQGDGEVAISAIETGAIATVRLSIHQAKRSAMPHFRTAGPLLPRTNSGPWFGTTGIGPDLLAAAKTAIREMIAALSERYGLSREEAYVLCSVAVDLKITEIVDLPNYVVSALLPLSLFVGGERTEP